MQMRVIYIRMHVNNVNSGKLIYNLKIISIAIWSGKTSRLIEMNTILLKKKILLNFAKNIVFKKSHFSVLDYVG